MTKSVAVAYIVWCLVLMWIGYGIYEKVVNISHLTTFSPQVKGNK